MNLELLESKNALSNHITSNQTPPENRSIALTRQGQGGGLWEILIALCASSEFPTHKCLVHVK